MKIGVVLRRFLTPSPVVSVLAVLRFRAFISLRAEVELSDRLHLGRGVRVSSFTKIKATHGEVRLGARTSIATGCFISAGENGTLIGSDCLIGPNTTIVSGAWRFSRLDETFESQGQSSKGTVIGDNVFVGAGSAILDGARIGSGVMIGANSVVSGTVPDNAIVQGNPAKVVFVRR